MKKTNVERVQGRIDEYKREENRVKKEYLARLILDEIIDLDFKFIDPHDSTPAATTKQEKIPNGNPVLIENAECIRDPSDLTSSNWIFRFNGSQREHVINDKFFYKDISEVKKRGDKGKIYIEKWLAIREGLIPG